MYTAQSRLTGQARLGVGHSDHDDASTAALDALVDALAGRMPARGDLVFAFASIDYDEHALMSVMGSAAEPARVVGCSAQGAFTTASNDTKGVAVVYVPRGELTTGVATVAAPDGDLHRAAREATSQAKREAGEAGPESVVLVLSNHTAAQRDVVRGAYEIAGARVPLVGGTAASNPAMDPTWLALDDTIVNEGVTAVWLNSPHPLGVAVDHGWHPVSEPMLVTRARENVIMELDGRPALDTYVKARGRPAPPDGDGVQFGWEALDMPLGLPTPTGGYEVRHIWDCTSQGGLEMFGYVHDQAVVRVMSGEHEKLIEGARSAVREAVSQLVTPCRGALVFSCTARAALFGDRIGDELMAVSSALDAPAAGFFTAGEYARRRGSTGFHNGSVAVLAL